MDAEKSPGALTSPRLDPGRRSEAAPEGQDGDSIAEEPVGPLTRGRAFAVCRVAVTYKRGDGARKPGRGRPRPAVARTTWKGHLCL